MTSADYVAALDRWHAERIERLRAPDGWLTLVALEWLSPGVHRVGAASDNDIVLPTGPQHLGTLRVADGHVHLTAAPGMPLASQGHAMPHGELVSDRGGKPTKVDAGTLTLQVIERDGRLGLRVRDREARERREFRGIERFAADERLRITARWEPYATPKRVRAASAGGIEQEHVLPGIARFTVDGQPCALEPYAEEGSSELFFVFGDATNRHETYGGGRFLMAPAPSAGTVLLDFNKAYNPPCVFTPHATCPLPTTSNRLPVRITAGEKTYGH